jgi:hypothetical protein
LREENEELKKKLSEAEEKIGELVQGLGVQPTRLGKLPLETTMRASFVFKPN